MQFDGVFFQKHMETKAPLNAEQGKSFLMPIEKYRIYAFIDWKANSFHKIPAQKKN